MPLQIVSMFSSYKLYSFILQTVILQTIPVHLANCTHSSCKLSSCKLYPFLPFQRWAVQYGLIAHGTNVDLKSFPLVKAYFERLSFDEVS